MELPSQLSEQSLNLLALVASMPYLGRIGDLSWEDRTHYGGESFSELLDNKTE